MIHHDLQAWLVRSLLLAAGTLVLAGAAQAYEYRDDFEGWPSDVNKCEWHDVYNGQAPSACNDAGIKNPMTFAPQECRSGSNCIAFGYGSKDETHNIYPKMSGGSTTGSPPGGWSKGGYFSYYVRFEPGFVFPENSLKTARIVADGTAGVNAMMSFIQWDGSVLKSRTGSNPETSCSVQFPFASKNGQWIRLEWYVDRPARTVKTWVTSEDGTKANCVNTNMNFYEDNSTWNLFWIGGNYSSDRPSGSGFGGRGAWDDICFAPNESARTGFCAPENFPLNGGGSSDGDTGSGGSSGGGSTGGGSTGGGSTGSGSTGGATPQPGSETTVACSDDVNGLLFCDGFESGAWEGFSDGGDPLAVTSNEVGYGTYALTATIPDGGVDGGYLSAFFADHPLEEGGPGAKVDDLWFSMRVRFASGFDHNDNTKIATVGAFEDWDAGYPGPWSFSPFYMSVVVDTGRHVYSQIHRKTTGDAWETHAKGQGPQLQPDTWHDLVYHLKLNTRGQSDGVIELWIDGVKAHTVTNANFRDSYDAKGWNTLTLSSYHTGAVQSSSTQYWDEVVITEAPIGQAQPVQPLAAPVLLP